MSDTSRPVGTAGAYEAVGVDVDANDRLIPRYRALARTAQRPEQLGAVGAYSGLFDLSGFERPVLAASTDGVGTKVMIASLAGRLDGVGRDLVNHCINDILCAGAAPLFFLDYLAATGMSEDDKVAVVSGVADACRESGVALLGGETADMPDLYPDGHFDLAGTIVGVIEQDREISGAEIAPGDIVLGLPSNGLHTNGYSLARAVFRLRPEDGAWDVRRERLAEQPPSLGESIADALLRPHRSYWQQLRGSLVRIKGIAHITGGGVGGNIERILPAGVRVQLDANRWARPPIFDLIQQRGEVAEAEMYRVFNMGLGMAVVVASGDADALLAEIDGALQIGEVLTSDVTVSDRVAIMSASGVVE